MKNEDLPFSFILAFILHFAVLAIYDLTKDFGSVNIDEPRIIKIKLGTSSDIVPLTKTKNQEVKIQKTVEEVGTIQEEPEIEQKKIDIQVTEIKERGSEFGNSLDEDAIISPTYLDLLQFTVQERSSIPAKAVREQIYGSAMLRLTFDRDGFVQKFKLVKSSGHTILDQEALRVAKSLMTAPFPKAPDSFDEDSKIMTYDFPISFSE